MAEGTEKRFVDRVIGASDAEKRATAAHEKNKRGTPPQKTSSYWKWLAFGSDTEPTEAFLSFISAWFALTLFSILAVDPAKWSPLVQRMDNMLPLRWWAIILLVASIVKLVGLAFRLPHLRLAGLLVSVGFWSTLSSLTALLTFFTPAWGGYAIIGLMASWACVRTAWEVSDPLAVWLRGRLKAGGHVRDTRHE